MTILPFSVAHTGIPYATVGRTSVVYSWRDRRSDGHHVDAAILEIVVTALVIFSHAFLMCSPQWSFGSSQKPRTLMLFEHSSTSAPWMFTVLCSCCICLLVLLRCISWYFFGAKVDPCFLAHALHFLCALSSCLQLPVSSFPYVTRFVSSINPSPIVSFSTWSNSCSSSDM